MSFFNKITNLNAAWYVFILAFLYRVPSITRFVNDDDSLWKYRGYVFGDALFNLDFARTAVTYHPGVPLMWSQMLAIKAFGVLDALVFKGSLIGTELFYYNHLIQNLFLLFFNSILITLVFILVRRILGEKNAVLFILILLLEPFFIALGRSLHNDLLVALFVYLGFLGYFIFSITPYNFKNFFSVAKSKLIIVTGLFVALGLLTKSASLFLVPMLLSVLILFSIADRHNFKKYIYGLIWILVYTAAFYVLIWPAMWVAPGQTLWLYFYKGIFDTAIEDGHMHTWFGKETMDPGYLFYPVVLAGRYTLLTFFGTLMGFVLLLIKLFKEKFALNKLGSIDKFVVLNAVFFVGFLVMLSITSKKLDRYTIPMFFPMVVLTVYSVLFLKKRFGDIVFKLVIAILLVRIVLLAWIHPNYLAYYSPLVGGFDQGRTVIEPKWVVGFDKVADYLNSKNSEADHRLYVVTPDAHLLSYLGNFKTIYPENVEAVYGEYYVVPSWKPKTADMIKTRFKLDDTMIIKTIKIAGVDYYDIYKVPEGRVLVEPVEQ